LRGNGTFTAQDNGGSNVVHAAGGDLTIPNDFYGNAVYANVDGNLLYGNLDAELVVVGGSIQASQVQYDAQQLNVVLDDLIARLEALEGA
jgi:hypothetical protein